MNGKAVDHFRRRLGQASTAVRRWTWHRRRHLVQQFVGGVAFKTGSSVAAFLIAWIATLL